MILYLYRKKVVWIEGFDCGVGLVKVLILVGFYDIGCDNGGFWCEWLESGNFAGFCGVLIWGFDF